MVRTLLSLSTAAAVGIAITAAPAQSASGSHPDPLDAAASTPKAPYESVLKGYRGLGEGKPTPWSDANDTVKRIGGWRAYARETNAPATPAASAPDHGSHKH
jgi:hypothetical protein